MPRWTGAACRACGKPIEIDWTPDGLCALVEAGTGRSNAAWAAWQRAKQANALHDPHPLAILYRGWLRRYAGLGLRVRVEILGDGCRSCRALARADYAPVAAPELANPDCRMSYRICFCGYPPVLPPR